MNAQYETGNVKQARLRDLLGKYVPPQDLERVLREIELIYEEAAKADKPNIAVSIRMK